MGTYTCYTEQEDDIIRKMNAKGYTPKDIIKVLISRSAKQIADRGYSLGLKWSRTPEVDMDEFKRLMKEK